MLHVSLPRRIHYMILDKPCYLFDGTSFFDVQTVRLNNSADVLNKLGSTAAKRVIAAFGIADNPNPISVVAANSLCYMGIQLDTLRVSCRYTVIPEPPGSPPVTPGVTTLAPSFVSDNGVPLSIVFPVPAALQVRLGVVAGYEGGQWVWRGTNLAARITGVPGDWLLPLPNVYTDSSVCMGRNFGAAAATLAELVELVYASFVSSTWNSDLLESRLDKARTMFRIVLRSTTPEPEIVPLPTTPDVLRSLMTPVNHPALVHYY